MYAAVQDRAITQMKLGRTTARCFNIHGILGIQSNPAIHFAANTNSFSIALCSLVSISSSPSEGVCR